MHIIGLLHEMGELTEKLTEAAGQLHDKDERLKLQGFSQKYDIINFQIQNQLQLISIAMMETDWD